MLDDARMFQEIHRQSGTGNHTGSCKCNVQIFPETGRIIVDASSGVAECLHDGIHHQNLFLQITVWSLLDFKVKFKF